MDALPVFLKLDGASVLLLGDGEGAEPKRRLLEAAGAKVVGAPEPHTRIAIIAIDDEEEAREAATTAREQGLLVNVVDKPALCDFSFPAIVDRSPVVLAIGTGGASASLSKVVRERLEALLPAGLGAVADAVRSMRAEVNAAIKGAAARRGFWDALMRPGGALDPLAPAEDARAAIAAALAGDAANAGGVTRIALWSDDPDDLTLRQLRSLSQADRIYAAPDVAAAIIDRARRDAERLPLSAFAEPVAGRVVVLTREERLDPGAAT